MRVMILAAGRGERMRPLTDLTPKPLLKIGGQTLIERHLLQLAKDGFKHIVINVHHLAEQLIDYLGDGSRYGLSIQYSHESILLGSGGGVQRALPLLGEHPFLLLSADIFTDFSFAHLKSCQSEYAHLVMTAPRAHHPDGDYGLKQGKIYFTSPPRLSYAGIAVCHPRLFEHSGKEIFSISELWDKKIQAGKVTGERYEGVWENIGTPAQLKVLK